MRPEKRLIEMDALASGRSIPRLRKTMIVLATAAALTGGLTADAFARGGNGGGHMGGGGGHMGGFGGVHMGGGFAGGRMGGVFGGPHMGGGVGGPHMGGGFRPHFAARRGRLVSAPAIWASTTAATTPCSITIPIPTAAIWTDRRWARLTRKRRGVPHRGEHRQAAKRAAADIEGHSEAAEHGQPG